MTGALISSYLIPSFTRGWQNHQKELELKSGLVSQMTESSTSMLLVGRFGHFDQHTNANERGWLEAWHTWQIRSAVIGSRLTSYFPHGSVATDWNDFVDEVNVFFNVSAMGPEEIGLWCLHASLLTTSPAAARVDRSWGRAPIRSTHIDCVNAGRLPTRSIERTYRMDATSEWMAVEHELYARRDELVKDVLKSHVKSF